MDFIISFVKLGIEGLNINRKAFTIFNVSIYWYALIITSGVILAAVFCMLNAKRFGLTQDNVLDSMIYGVPAGIIGARLYYVLFNIDEINSFWDIFAIREGGLAIYGGVIAAGITGVIFCKIKKINAFSVFDLGGLGFLIGQAVGRWGNFFNGEVYGGPTSLPWGMTIYDKQNAILAAENVHPLFLYESLWNILGFILIYLFVRLYKKRFPGQAALLYVIWYGAGRGFLEGLRNPAFNLRLLSFNISQVLGYASAVTALCIFVYFTFIHGFICRKKADTTTDTDAAVEIKAGEVSDAAVD